MGERAIGQMFAQEENTFAPCEFRKTVIKCGYSSTYAVVFFAFASRSFGKMMQLAGRERAERSRMGRKIKRTKHSKDETGR
jgi:hypothetical protein